MSWILLEKRIFDQEKIWWPTDFSHIFLIFQANKILTNYVEAGFPLVGVSSVVYHFYAFKLNSNSISTGVRQQYLRSWIVSVCQQYLRSWIVGVRQQYLRSWIVGVRQQYFRSWIVGVRRQYPVHELSVFANNISVHVSSWSAAHSQTMLFSLNITDTIQHRNVWKTRLIWHLRHSLFLQRKR